MSTKLLAAATFDGSRYARGTHAFDDDILTFSDLEVEWAVDVIDLLHDFCFTLRKVIERTAQVDLSQTIIPHADTSAVFNAGQFNEKCISLNQKSLWWWLGRVIHSQSVHVLDGGQTFLSVYEDGKTREHISSREYVVVSSDLDAKSGVEHVLHVPSLIAALHNSGLRGAIEHRITSDTSIP